MLTRGGKVKGGGQSGVVTRAKTSRDVLETAASDWMARNRSLVLRQTPVWARSLAAVFVALGSLAVIGGFLFRIDEVVTVQGRLESVGGSVEVMTPTGGQVTEVLFQDGDRVVKGQPLVRFDTTEAAKEAATLTRMIDLEQSELRSKLETLESRRNVLRIRNSVLQQKLLTKEEIVESLRALMQEGGFQRLQFLEQRDQVLELSNQITQLDEELLQIDFQATQLQLETNQSIGQMRNNLVKAQLQLKYQNVVAPTDGIVFDPQASPQGVIAPGERILTLVPQDNLYARVFIPNQDIGFVRVGQESKVRIDAYPFARYGDIEGKVDQIGADSLPPDETSQIYRFPAKIQLSRPYLETQEIKIPLQSGMAVTTNLKLREKPVISLVSDLLVDQLDAVRSLRQQ